MSKIDSHTSLGNYKRVKLQACNIDSLHEKKFVLKEYYPV